MPVFQPIDSKTSMTNGSTAVTFSMPVEPLSPGQGLLFSSQWSTAYYVATFAGDALACTLTAPFTGPTGTCQTVFFPWLYAGRLALGATGPFATGAASVSITLGTQISMGPPNANDPTVHLMLDSQPTVTYPCFPASGFPFGGNPGDVVTLNFGAYVTLDGRTARAQPTTYGGPSVSQANVIIVDICVDSQD